MTENTVQIPKSTTMAASNLGGHLVLFFLLILSLFATHECGGSSRAGDVQQLKVSMGAKDNIRMIYDVCQQQESYGGGECWYCPKDGNCWWEESDCLENCTP